MKIESLRYSRDTPVTAGVKVSPGQAEELQDSIRRNHLSVSTKISGAIFPEISSTIEKVLKRLQISSTLDVYVQNSHDAQAFCLPGTETRFSIILTSGLIQLFSTQELQFVVGHEIGHFVFGHHAYPQEDSTTSQIRKLNILALKRASEISADRLGFLSVTNNKTAFKAILKLATGLPDKFIRFDLSAYLDQARELHKMGGSQYGLLSTHPTCTTRLKALLWFEMSEPYHEWTGKKGLSSIDSTLLDKRIDKDMAAANGFRLSAINGEELDNALLWGVFSLFLADNRLSKEEQLLMKETFGQDVALSALKVAKSGGPTEVMARFEKALNNIQLIDENDKKSLFNKLKDISSLAGGEEKQKVKILSKVETILNISLPR